MANLRVIKQLVAFGDSLSTNNPRLRYVDWNRDISDLEVQNPRSESHILAPGQEKLLFDGTRTLAVDGTTELSVALVPGEADRYRFRFTGGTNPVFRTNRGLELSGASVSVVLNANSTATMTVAGDGGFESIVAGDTLWVPGTEESISSPFHAANQGFWLVMAATATSLTLTRPSNTDFEAYTQSAVSVTADNQIVAYSSAGVQVGDRLEVGGGFVATTWRTYSIVGVTPSYIEVVSTAIIPSETDILPSAAGFKVFTSLKSFVYIEADQDCVVRVNGDTSNCQRLAPWLAGDSAKPASYERTGPTWALTVVNRSTVAMSLTIVSVE